MKYLTLLTLLITTPALAEQTSLKNEEIADHQIANFGRDGVYKYKDGFEVRVSFEKDEKPVDEGKVLTRGVYE